MMAQKIMLLGEIGVGKTSLVTRVLRNVFTGTYLPTIGVDVHKHVVTDAGPARDQRVDIVIWDTDGNFGQSIFRHVYIKGASAAMIVADATRPLTLERMLALAAGFEDAFPGRPIALVLNKWDLVQDPVRFTEPEPLARSRHLRLKTSAKTGENVRDAFTTTATIMLRRAA